MTGHVKVRTGSRPDRDRARRATSWSGCSSDDVVAVGIGIPGRLDRDGTSILSAGYVDLAGLRLGELISASIGRPVVLDNDAHMALVAELAMGAATDADARRDVHGRDRHRRRRRGVPRRSCAVVATPASSAISRSTRTVRRASAAAGAAPRCSRPVPR